MLSLFRRSCNITSHLYISFCCCITLATTSPRIRSTPDSCKRYIFIYMRRMTSVHYPRAGAQAQGKRARLKIQRVFHNPIEIETMLSPTSADTSIPVEQQAPETERQTPPHPRRVVSCAIAYQPDTLDETERHETTHLFSIGFPAPCPEFLSIRMRNG